MSFIYFYFFYVIYLKRVQSWRVNYFDLLQVFLPHPKLIHAKYLLQPAFSEKHGIKNCPYWEERQTALTPGLLFSQMWKEVKPTSSELKAQLDFHAPAPPLGPTNIMVLTVHSDIMDITALLSDTFSNKQVFKSFAFICPSLHSRQSRLIFNFQVKCSEGFCSELSVTAY